MSTIDVYIQRELGDEQFVFEDPDYQITGGLPHHDAQELAMRNVDLEKGGAYTEEITRKDSTFPILDDENDEVGRAGSGDTRSSQSRR